MYNVQKSLQSSECSFHTKTNRDVQVSVSVILDKYCAVILLMAVCAEVIYLFSSHGTDIDLAVGVFTPADGVCRLFSDPTVGRVTTGDRPSWLL